MTDKVVEPEWAELARQVSVNPAQIRWPANNMGILQIVALRKALAEAAAAMKGNPEKEALVIGTIMVGLAHIKKRRDKDKTDAAARQEHIRATAAERTPRESWHPLKKEA